VGNAEAVAGVAESKGRKINILNYKIMFLQEQDTQSVNVVF
jgi:hypothetical protein